MDKTERIYRIHACLKRSRTPVTLEKLSQEAECTTRNVSRLIKDMRERLGAPVEFNRQLAGYEYTENNFELPGIWLSASELTALAAMQGILKEVEPGIFKDQFNLVRKQIDTIYKKGRIKSDITDRIKVINIGSRSFQEDHYMTLAEALVNRKRIEIEYHPRSERSAKATTRIVSPQRLIRYRDNWYLDCHCHLRNELRTFALEQIKQASIRNEIAKDIPRDKLDDYFSTAFGIFSGKPDKTAVLNFTKHRAQWVSCEKWHPQQKGTWNEDGTYTLKLPYKHETELIMDILKYGTDVEVIAPEDLRNEVKTKLKDALTKYS